MNKFINGVLSFLAALLLQHTSVCAQISDNYIRLTFDLYFQRGKQVMKIKDRDVLTRPELSTIGYRFTIKNESPINQTIDSFPIVLNEFERSLFFFRIIGYRSSPLPDSSFSSDFERPLRKVVASAKPGKATIKPGQTYTMPKAIPTPYFKNLPTGGSWVQARYKKSLLDGQGYYLQVSDNQVHFFVKD